MFEKFMEILKEHEDKGLPEDVYCPNCLTYYRLGGSPFCSVCGSPMLFKGAYIKKFNLVDKELKKCNYCETDTTLNRVHRFCEYCGKENIAIADLINYKTQDEVDPGIGVENWVKEMGEVQIKYGKAALKELTFNLYSGWENATEFNIKGSRAASFETLTHSVYLRDTTSWISPECISPGARETKFEMWLGHRSEPLEKIEDKWVTNVEKLPLKDLLSVTTDTLYELKIKSFLTLWNNLHVANTQSIEMYRDDLFFYSRELDKLITVELDSRERVHVVSPDDPALQDMSTLKNILSVFELEGFDRKTGRHYPTRPIHPSKVKIPRKGGTILTIEEFKDILRKIHSRIWDHSYEYLTSTD